jgi:hypothetical protein
MKKQEIERELVKERRTMYRQDLLKRLWKLNRRGETSVQSRRESNAKVA